MSVTQTDTLDPITFEVLRHKVDEVVAEAYHTIGRVSGSPVVSDAGDHQEVICTASGELVAIGAGSSHWVRSIAAGIRHVSSSYGVNPGFEPGDQFLLNDTSVAANHAPDVQLLAPIFWEGEIVAWVGTASHQMDIGGMNPGGHHVHASDIYAEGFMTRGLKLVERGMIRKDIEDTFANMVRQPAIGLLDVRAKIASNNVMRERLLELVGRYGVETILGLFAQLMTHSERRLRARLKDVADGEWSTRSYIEGHKPGSSLSVALRLVKQGDRLEFDFSGTDQQSSGAENLGGAGATSICLGALMVTLAHDLPWNEGLFRPVDFVMPEGSLVKPRHPAAVSSNIPSGAAALVAGAAQEVVGKMLLTSEQWRQEAAAVTGVNAVGPIFAGKLRDGATFTTLIMDGLASGGGALTDSDGENTSSNPWTIRSVIGNVEMTEMLFPLMYLWRREAIDSSGPGEYRGGLGIDEAIMPWKSEELALVTVGCGQSARGVAGLEGGYPGANLPLLVVRDADVAASHFSHGDVPSLPRDLGDTSPLVGVGVTTLAPRDVLLVHNATGGGGYGDPIVRDPARVASDVVAGQVSREVAANTYGVVLHGRHVDEGATTERRASIRAHRLERAHAPARDEVPPVPRTPCPNCSERLGDGGRPVLVYDEPVAESAPLTLQPADDRFMLRFVCCGACGGLLDVALRPRVAAPE
jgi:N-methylhydantoinase B